MLEQPTNINYKLEEFYINFDEVNFIMSVFNAQTGQEVEGYVGGYGLKNGVTGWYNSSNTLVRFSLRRLHTSKSLS